MQKAGITMHLSVVKKMVTISDNLFDIDLTPHEALELLAWLRKNEVSLRALERTPSGKRPALRPGVTT